MSYTAPRRPAVKGTGRVKPPKTHTAAPAEILKNLSEAVRQIQQHNASKLSFEEQYRHAYNLVTTSQGHTLYNTVADLVSAHLEKEALDRIVPAFPPSTSSVTLASGSGNGAANIAAAAAAQIFLGRLVAVWADHLMCMGKLRDVLKYMDKTYTGSNSLPTTWDLGLSLFLHHVLLFSADAPPKPLRCTVAAAATVRIPSRPSAAAATPATRAALDRDTVAKHLVTALLDLIRIEREGEPISRSTIRSAVEILSEITDEGPVPPVTASSGVGSGSPVLGGTQGGPARSTPAMGTSRSNGQESPYMTSFEVPFLAQTQEFYEAESARLLVECDAPRYLVRISKRLEEEALRAQSYLNSSTERFLIALLERVLITDHLSAVLDHSASGLSTLIQDTRTDDLNRLYTLFGRVPTGHTALQAGISAWIIRVGKQVNDGLIVVVEEDAPDPKGKGKAVEGAPVAKKAPVDTTGAKTKAALAWVQNVLDLKDKFDTILIKAFAADKAFEKSINDAFTEFVNQNIQSPEYISLFVDENLKKGLKGKTEAEVDVVLNKTIALFRFLVEKDRFERYYNSHLAKRLISQRSVSDDAERNMLAKFKIEAGAAFTKSAEGMMKDVKVSEDTLAEYKRYQDRQAVKAPFDMVTIVCGRNFWPFTNKEMSCEIPPVLNKGIDAFRTFYNVKHSGRILTFRPELGNVELKAKFKERSHELSISTHAAIVLLMFEGLAEDETLSYAVILETTKMAKAELCRTLQTLACAKYKLLTKIPKGREVDETDSFTYNTAFSCPLAKIKIQTVANKVETSEESKETEDKVDKGRDTLCDACIVRVMKDRKFLTHTELVNTVIVQLAGRFLPRPAMVKKAIERLIEKEYLMRDESDRHKLRYVA